MRQEYNPRRPAVALLSLGGFLALLFSMIGSTSAQIADTDICACSPRVYQLTFDFTLECEPINVDLESGGIADATCLVTGFDDINVTDLVPVAVSSVQLIEIGEDGGPAAVAQETGDFRDGSTINYTSISFEGAVAPRAFQLRALGRNAAGEPLVLQWAVTYSNNCGVWPVLEINDSIGWTIFTGLAEPLALVCPAVITPSPTLFPTELTPSPTMSPTVPPTEAPTPVTPEPTESPSAPPTAPPTESPTPSPTVTPGVPTSPPTTLAPTTMAPTTLPPTSPPTVPDMSFSYSYSYSFDWDDIDSADVEFGRDDAKPPCRKRKVRRVRKVRKLRSNLDRFKKEDSAPKKKAALRDGHDSKANVTDEVSFYSADESMPMVSGDESIPVDAESVEETVPTDSEDTSAITVPEESIDESVVPESSVDDEYEYVEEVVEVEECEDDYNYRHHPSSSKGKGGYSYRSSSKGSGKGGKGSGYSSSYSSKGKGGSSSSSGKGSMSLKHKSSKGHSKKSVHSYGGSRSKGSSASKKSYSSKGNMSMVSGSGSKSSGKGGSGSKSSGKGGSGSKSSRKAGKGGSSKGRYSSSKGSSHKLSKKGMPAEGMSRLRIRSP